jgi:hypothetical protein
MFVFNTRSSSSKIDNKTKFVEEESKEKKFKHIPEDFQVARIVVRIVVRCISGFESE